jgi:hypothetical protein
MVTEMFKHFSEHFFAFLLGIFDSNLCAPASPPPRQINPFLNMDSSPYSSAASPSHCGRLAKSPLMINHTTAGDEQQNRVATMERSEHATNNH